MGQNGKRSNCSTEDEDFDDEFSDQLQHPQQRNAANARERARMRVLSRAFCRLKTTLPWVPPDTKLSKLDTLRLATSYIAHLRTMLKLSENEIPKHSVQPTNMSWPFNFNVNWETQTMNNDQHATISKSEWKSCEFKKHNDLPRTPTPDFEKSRDYRYEHKFSNHHRNIKVRRKPAITEEMDSITLHANQEFNYYKPYSYYET